MIQPSRMGTPCPPGCGNFNQLVGNFAHTAWSSNRAGLLHFQRVSAIGTGIQ
jgi:hypothetical protein